MPGVAILGWSDAVQVTADGCEGFGDALRHLQVVVLAERGHLAPSDDDPICTDDPVLKDSVALITTLDASGTGA